MQKDLTTGSVFKNVLYFSLPYLLSYFLQTLYGMADLFIIGRFEGTASITAVSIGSQIMHMITVMLVGLAMGVTVGIGLAVGAHDDRGAGAVIGNAVMLFLAVSVVLAAVLTALVQPILSIMSTPAEAVPGAAAYLTICFIGIPCITAYNIIASIFRGLGDSRSPMYFIAVACAANIGLDYLFMGALHMGPAGAALGAQNVGAGKHDRAAGTLYYAIGISLTFGAIVGVLVQFIAPQCRGSVYHRCRCGCGGRLVSARVYLGLLLCGYPLQLQRVFLRLRPQRAFVPA